MNIYDFEDRDREQILQQWSSSIDCRAVNDILCTFMKFKLIKRNWEKSIVGTYFEKRWILTYEKERGYTGGEQVLGNLRLPQDTIST